MIKLNIQEIIHSKLVLKFNKLANLIISLMDKQYFHGSLKLKLYLSEQNVCNVVSAFRRALLFPLL